MDYKPRDCLKIKLLDSLKQVIPEDPHPAICAQLKELWSKRKPSHVDVTDLFDALRDLFSTWPHFSGNYYFPVPAPSSSERWIHNEPPTRAVLHYNEARDGIQIWSGEYGEMRKNLLAFCIKKLEDELIEETDFDLKSAEEEFSQLQSELIGGTASLLFFLMILGFILAYLFT